MSKRLGIVALLSNISTNIIILLRGINFLVKPRSMGYRTTKAVASTMLATAFALSPLLYGCDTTHKQRKDETLTFAHEVAQPHASMWDYFVPTSSRLARCAVFMKRNCVGVMPVTLRN